MYGDRGITLTVFTCCRLQKRITDPSDAFPLVRRKSKHGVCVSSDSIKLDSHTGMPIFMGPTKGDCASLGAPSLANLECKELISPLNVTPYSGIRPLRRKDGKGATR